MKRKNIVAGIVTVLCIAALPCVMAASDDEILNFARGVMAADYSDTTVGVEIVNDTLQVWKFQEKYDKPSLGDIGRDLWQLACSAETIVQEYPERFDTVILSVFTSDGRGPVGVASVEVFSVEEH
ncbi:MAG: hypothetical protein U9N48_04985 [Euryarchaeota archaeon]|nr:hypothetical protein [Euryarchaeota archaeon]